MAKQVLIVDDSATMRQLVEHTLKRGDYEVIVAVNGKDALAKTSNTKVDMVITDLNMPEMDGIALIKELRNTTATRFTPIVMLTTESLDAKQQEGKKAGASGWIVKPFHPDKLLEVVKKLMK